jgi:hypothetical protein
LIIAIFSSERWYPMVVLIFISMIISDLLMFYWPISCLLWKNIYSGLLIILNQVILIFFLLSCINFLYILDYLLLIVHMVCKYFLPFCRLPFHLLVLCYAETGYFDFISLVYFYLCFCVLSNKITAKTNVI